MEPSRGKSSVQAAYFNILLLGLVPHSFALPDVAVPGLRRGHKRQKKKRLRMNPQQGPAPVRETRGYRARLQFPRNAGEISGRFQRGAGLSGRLESPLSKSPCPLQPRSLLQQVPQRISREPLTLLPQDPCSPGSCLENCCYIFTYGGDKDVPSCHPCNPQTGESHHKSHFILWTNKCWSKIFQGRPLNTCIAAVV